MGCNVKEICRYCKATVTGIARIKYFARTLYAEYSSLHRLCELENKKATSECQYRCDSFGPYRYECRRVSACDKVLS